MYRGIIIICKNSTNETVPFPCATWYFRYRFFHLVILTQQFCQRLEPYHGQVDVGGVHLQVNLPVDCSLAVLVEILSHLGTHDSETEERLNKVLDFRRCNVGHLKNNFSWENDRTQREKSNFFCLKRRIIYWILCTWFAILVSVSVGQCVESCPFKATA